MPKTHLLDTPKARLADVCTAQARLARAIRRLESAIAYSARRESIPEAHTAELVEHLLGRVEAGDVLYYRSVHDLLGIGRAAFAKVWALARRQGLTRAKDGRIVDRRVERAARIERNATRVEDLLLVQEDASGMRCHQIRETLGLSGTAWADASAECLSRGTVAWERDLRGWLVWRVARDGEAPAVEI
jgi:predicted DNA-binding transcriptional regulator